MNIQRLFQKTLFGIFLLFGVIAVSTSWVCIATVDSQLSEEYVSNSKGIAKTIADASVDIILNRDLSALQSLIDQFLEIQGINYIYIVNENGEFLAHTFVPGIPEEILSSDPSITDGIERSFSGAENYIEVGSPILAGVAGSVHIGMDKGLISLKIQRAVGRQMYLISSIFVVGIFAAIWLVNLAAKPVSALLGYAVELAKAGDGEQSASNPLLERDDEAGQLARLFLYFAKIVDPDRVEPQAVK
ncbi:MAG: hypothetical protein OXF72_06870 [Gammaproteobacteria bacterium]|nr:hypothetical protein [Gammaproteobacteria bacterium]MCY4199580.1 hypothetical protein [Gammaproteobacteria bacterium]MCY4277965.1 hypothetical protein [Gammaproteobacteria bacterium]MCY4324097.1 hypothetical protein [Gammaproteobacteria bacterium]